MSPDTLLRPLPTPRRGVRPAPRLALALALAWLSVGSASAVPVSGRVLRPDATPAVGVDVDFIDATGTNLPLSGDQTDPTGTYAIDVPPGLYTVRHEAPVGGGLAHREIEGVEVLAPASVLPDVTLSAGFTVSGLVTDPGGTGLPGVNTAWFDALTGVQQLTYADNTDAFGTYGVLIPVGTWDVRYDPAPGDPYVSVTVEGVVVAANAVRPDVVLPAGLRVSALVTDPGGAPVVGANTAFHDAAGETVRTVDDGTDASGVFRTWVASGDYDLQVWPPAGTGLLTGRLTGLSITVDTTLPDIVLEAGSAVTGRVVNAAAAPIPGVDTDWNLPGGTVLTPEDNTDLSGTYRVAVPDGTYEVDLDPPTGARYAAARVAGVVVAGPTVLPDFVLESAWFVTGRVVDGAGVPIFDVSTSTRASATQEDVRTLDDGTDPAGEFLLVLPDGAYDIEFRPPAGAPLAAVRLLDQAVAGADLLLPDVVLPEGFLLEGVVVDGGGAPVAGVDLDVVDPASGERLVTPGDTTDAAGAYSTRVPAGTWDLVYQPPGPFLEASFPAVDVVTDTTRPDVVLLRGFVLSGRVEDRAAAPVAGADVAFRDPGTGTARAAPAVTDLAGAFTRLVGEGDVRVVTTPARDSGLAGDTRDVTLTADEDLGGIALLPLLESVAPASGTVAGGDLLTLTGRELVAGLTVDLGGSPAAVTVLSPTSAELTTGAHPAGIVDVVAAWPGGRTAVLRGGYEYTSSMIAPDVRLRREGADVVIAWAEDPGVTRLLFASPWPDVFDAGSLQGTTTGLEWRDAGAAAQPGLRCYRVE